MPVTDNNHHHQQIIPEKEVKQLLVRIVKAVKLYGKFSLINFIRNKKTKI